MPPDRLIKSPFTITLREAMLLNMHDSGMTNRQISDHFGYSKRSGGVWSALTAALEKRALLALDNRKPTGHTRLAVARGAKRMDRDHSPYRGLS